MIKHTAFQQEQARRMACKLFDAAEKLEGEFPGAEVNVTSNDDEAFIEFKSAAKAVRLSWPFTSVSADFYAEMVRAIKGPA